MNISIFASIGCQNLGDELILKNEISIFEDMYKNKSKNDINFKVFTYDISDFFYKKDNIDYLEYFPINIKKTKYIYRNIKNFLVLIKTIIQSDLIIIGGGGLFFDRELQKNKNPLILWCFRSKLFKIFRKKVIFYGVGIDIKKKKNLSKIKKIFSNAYKIYVRDKYSKNLLKKLNINSIEISDPVFFDNKKLNKRNNCLKAVKSKDFTIEDLKTINFKRKKVGLAFRKGYFKNEKKDTIKIIIDYIIKKGGKIILLPHSFHKIDKKANDYIFLKRYKTKDTKITDTKITENIKETYIIYKKKKIDICLSQRLHSIILSEVYNIKFIAISYSKKTDQTIKKITS